LTRFGIKLRGRWSNLILLCVAFTATAIHAEGLDADSFVSEKNAGKGTLLFHRDNNTEHVDFGLNGDHVDHYGFGIVFKTGLFPEASEFKGKYILQIALGNLHPRETHLLAQFGSIALLCKEFPSTLKLYPVVMNSVKTDFEEKALMLFGSPKTPADTSDEDRLRGTLFGFGGTVSINPVGKAADVELKGQGENVKFKMQVYHVELKTILQTPFKPGEGQLSGTMDIPIFWPHGAAAEKYAAKMASKSLTSVTTAVTIPEGITTHKRQLSGSTKKNKGEAPPPLPEN
jgi:hypothetical protein